MQGCQAELLADGSSVQQLAARRARSTARVTFRACQGPSTAPHNGPSLLRCILLEPSCRESPMFYYNASTFTVLGNCEGDATGVQCPNLVLWKREHASAKHPVNLLYYTVLYYIVLYYTMLYYIILYYTILFYIVRYRTIIYYAILYYSILSYTILYYLYYTILYYTMLYYTILYYTILCESSDCGTSCCTRANFSSCDARQHHRLGVRALGSWGFRALRV